MKNFNSQKKGKVMIEGRNNQGYVWIQDSRNGDYFYLQDFQHLVVAKVSQFSETLPQEHWEAIVFEDDRCRTILGRQEFSTRQEAQQCLEQLLEVSLKNRKK